MRLFVLAIALTACAPRIDGPVDHQRAIDRDDADRLATQLAQLPGAVRAEVTLHRSVRDPLTQAATTAGAAAIVVVDDRTDRDAVIAAARRLVHAAAPEIGDPSVSIEVGAVRPELAQVGPFTVAARDKPRLVGALAAALALIAALAGWIAWHERRR